MKITRGRLIAVGVGAGLVVALAAAMRPHPLVVDIATVSRTPLETTVDAEGRTRVRERYVVAAPVTGRLERIALLEGTPVRAGDVVARITPLPLDAQAAEAARARVAAADAAVREAEGRVPVADAALAQARRDAGRAHRLVEAGGVAPRDVEQAELALRGAENDARAARVRLVEPAAFTKVSALGVEEQRVNVILDFDDRPEELPPLGDGF
ncbi:MAG TPA: hypothetical protein VFS05_06665, partial [Gemmatimonadaceae bacterium]|nr:hypothetical protein [Gemmatimonadaceae bacterium]